MPCLIEVIDASYSYVLTRFKDGNQSFCHNLLAETKLLLDNRLDSFLVGIFDDTSHLGSEDILVDGSFAD